MKALEGKKRASLIALPVTISHKASLKPKRCASATLIQQTLKKEPKQGGPIFGTASNHLRLQKADAPSFSSIKQSSHQTKRNNKKLPLTGFKQQPICTPLAPRNKMKETKQLPPTDPILGPENLLKIGFAQKSLPSNTFCLRGVASSASIAGFGNMGSLSST